jgi:hypothetical protein
MRYLVNIQNAGNEYRGYIRSAESDMHFDLGNIRLGEDVPVEINGYIRTLGEITENLVYHRIENLETDFDEGGQLAVGRYLYAETFGKLNSPNHLKQRQDKDVEVRIITTDEHIARLPWVLLASGGVFLSTNGWSMALSSNDSYRDCVLPPSPKILLAMPEPSNALTKAEQHLEEIVRKLSTANSLYTLGGNLEVAYTWEQFEQLVQRFEPHVIYYYGHGIGDFYTSRLQFVTGERRETVEKPIIDVANCLLNMPNNPVRLVYLNCCQGDTGGLLGAGRQLGAFVPAVISNCTAAHIGTAQKQGLTLLQSILINAVTPHVAVAEMRRNLGNLNLSFSDVRWMTPVLHCHYDDWKAEKPRSRNRIDRDPDWQLKLNRVKQFSDVHSLTLQMLSHRSPHTLAYVWYGQEGQGVELFNQRVKVELQRYCRNANVHFREINVQWPLAISDFNSSMEYMLTKALGVVTLDEIASLINAEIAGMTNRESLLYIRPRPMHPEEVHPRMIKRYLAWWNAKLVPLLSRSKSYALIGLPFIVENSKEFENSLVTEGVDEWDFSHTGFRVLDEMGNLVRKDLIDYLLRYDIVDLPTQPRNLVIDNILEETNGKYELTMAKVRDIERLVWNHYEM